MMNLEDSYAGNGARLDANKRKRGRNQLLVTSQDNYMSAEDAMGEIFARKKARGASFREMKMADYRDRHGLTFSECEEYGFADAELRQKIKDGEIKGGFAGKDMSFPIWSPESVNDAWGSVGRSDQPTKKVQEQIIRLAQKHNWTSGLPKSVLDRMKKGGSGLPEG
tara:strand:- start:167 stop:664 length:498 start_codon:yes stop_codon:yes gene_type:complete